MKASRQKKVVWAWILTLFFTAPTHALCGDNARQAIINNKTIKSGDAVVKIHSENTFGKITTQDDSSVTIGDTKFPANGTKSTKITTENDTGKVVTKGNSRVIIGNVDISGVEDGTVDIYTKNTVNGDIITKEQSSTSMGTVNVH